MHFKQQLNVYLRARFPLVVLVTAEEGRALQAVKEVCEGLKRPCLTWDVADGFQTLAAGGPELAARDPLSALEQIDKADVNAVVFVLKDFHECWDNLQVKRKLRGVAQRLRPTGNAVLVTTPAAQVPDELRDEAVVVELPPPTAAELEAVLARLTRDGS